MLSVKNGSKITAPVTRRCRSLKFLSSPPLDGSPHRKSFISMDIESLTWQDIGVDLHEFNPELTLVPGQSFNWQRLGDDKMWVGIVDTHPLIFAQEGSTNRVASLDGSLSGEELMSLVREYLQLDIALMELYATWSTCCPRMKVVAAALPGIRLLNQNPWECLMSFIFSSNNNIKRITKGLGSLRSKYGNYSCSVWLKSKMEGKRVKKYWEVSIQEIPAISSPAPPTTGKKGGKRNLEPDPMDDESKDDTCVNLYTFPSVRALSSVSEEVFRAMGLGYRAKFIVGTTRIVREKGVEWLLGMRSRDRAAVQNDLISLPGVGRKVADCVALFSMKQCEAVPIDTHVWDIVLRDYSSYIPKQSESNALAGKQKETKTLTPFVYDRIGDAFRGQFMHHAGWAHSVLFAAELPDLRILLPQSMQQEMVSFSAEKSAMKKTMKKLKTESSVKNAAQQPQTRNVATEKVTSKKRAPR